MGVTSEFVSPFARFINSFPSAGGSGGKNCWGCKCNVESAVS